MAVSITMNWVANWLVGLVFVISKFIILPYTHRIATQPHMHMRKPLHF